MFCNTLGHLGAVAAVTPPSPLRLETKESRASFGLIPL